jgi:hypothetical protein
MRHPTRSAKQLWRFPLLGLLCFVLGDLVVIGLVTGR